MSDVSNDDQRTGANRVANRLGERPAMSRRGSLDDESYNEHHAEFGPWTEINSTRVAAVRYDPSNQAVQVQWTDHGAGYTYTGVSPETYRAFMKAGSKGRAIGLLGNNYRPASPQELDAPSM